MKEIGHVLRTAREKRNLSLDDIQERTKIRKYYLQAIEEGNLSALPGLVYARGFIRNYADQVGVDGQALMREHGLVDNPVANAVVSDNSSQAHDVKPVPAEQPVAMRDDVKKVSSQQREAASSQRTRVSPERPSTLLPQVIMGIAIIGLLGLGLWFLNNRPQASKPPAPPSAQQQANSSVAPTPAPQPNSPQPEPKTTEPLKAESKASGTSVYKVDGQNLKLELSSPNGECWVQVTIDGKLKESKTMEKGASATYEGSSEITVAAGLSPSLAIKINDRPVELEQIKDRYDYVFRKK